MKPMILLLLPILLFASCSERYETPLERSGYRELTDYRSMIEYLRKVSSESGIIDFYYLGETGNGYKIPYLEIGGKREPDDSAVTVMLFAQQHGNEQGGKEGMLRLIKEIANGGLDGTLKNVKLILIPQVNPEGGESDKRRNGNDVDLNRDHLLLSQRETMALHDLYHKYHPEVTADVHEYTPYSRSWMEYGYLKNFDMQIGTLTNPNVPEIIVDLSKFKLLPFIERKVLEAGFSFHEYIVGGPPDKSRMRFSTVDINDGRQSLGIRGTISLIFEGKNGKTSLDNIERRTSVHYITQRSLLEFCGRNAMKIKEIAHRSRAELALTAVDDSVTVRMEHVQGDTILRLNLLSNYSGIDTIIAIENFHPRVESRLKIAKPLGYLIPKTNEPLYQFVEKHRIEYSEYIDDPGNLILEYYFSGIDTSENEELKSIFPKTELEVIDGIDYPDYYFVPLSQQASILIATAFEPQSMIGLIQYREIFSLIAPGEKYPILRVERSPWK